MFKSQKEIWEYLIAGGKVKISSWEDDYIVMGDQGETVNKLGKSSLWFFHDVELWQKYHEPKPKRKVTLYRYTFRWEKDCVISQTYWSDMSFEAYFSNKLPKLLMTETKEVEI